MLKARMCVELSQPMFVIDQWPETELETWALIFHIRDHGDKPRVPKHTPVQSPKEQKAAMRRIMGGPLVDAKRQNNHRNKRSGRNTKRPRNTRN